MFMKKQHIKLTEEEEAVVTSKFSYKNYLKGQYIVQDGNIMRYQTLKYVHFHYHLNKRF